MNQQCTQLVRAFAAAIVLANASLAIAQSYQAQPSDLQASETQAALTRLRAFLHLPPTSSIEKLGVSLGLDVRDKPTAWDKADNGGRHSMTWPARNEMNPILMARFTDYIEISFSSTSCVTLDGLIHGLNAKINNITIGNNLKNTPNIKTFNI